MGSRHPHSIRGWDVLRGMFCQQKVNVLILKGIRVHSSCRTAIYRGAQQGRGDTWAARIMYPLHQERPAVTRRHLSLFAMGLYRGVNSTHTLGTNCVQARLWEGHRWVRNPSQMSRGSEKVKCWHLAIGLTNVSYSEGTLGLWSALRTLRKTQSCSLV